MALGWKGRILSLFSAIAWAQDLPFHNLDRLRSVGHAWWHITGTCVLDLSFSWLNVDTSAALLLSLKPISWAVHSACVHAWRVLHRREGRMLSPYPAFQGVPSWNLNFLTPWNDPTGTEHAKLHVLHYCPTCSSLATGAWWASSKPLPVSKARQGGHQQRAIGTSAFSAPNTVSTGLTDLTKLGVALPRAINLPSNKKLCQTPWGEQQSIALLAKTKNGWIPVVYYHTILFPDLAFCFICLCAALILQLKWELLGLWICGLCSIGKFFPW